MAKGIVYLVAVMDWFSRRVLAWRVSITRETDFCVEALRDAMNRHGQPEIFNTDQGVQFTSAAFLGELESLGVRISMDGKGRFLDNIFIERLWRSLKYEEVVCCERVASALRRHGALPEMGVGPPKSACRGRLQTATSCGGKEPSW
jgi:putative transposase